MRIYAYAVLALREGNAWRQWEYDAFFEEEGNERFLVGEGDGNGDEFAVLLSGGEATKAAGHGERVRVDAVETSTSTLTRRATAGMEEGRGSTLVANAESSRVGDPARISLDDWFTIGKWTQYSTANRNLTWEERWEIDRKERMIADRKAQRLLDARFRKNLEQVQDYEKGPTFRLTLWYPMVVQLAKVTLVSGARFTISMGMIYLASFLIIEGCLFAARKPLDRDDRAKAMKLLREWGMMKRGFLYGDHGKRGIHLEPASEELLVLVCNLVASIMNFWLFCRIMNFKPFAIVLEMFPLEDYTAIGKIFQVPWYWWFLMVPLYPILLIFCAFSQAMQALVSILILAYAPAIPFFISLVVADLVQSYEKYFSKVSDRTESRFAPAATAITTGVLAFVAYFGLLSVLGGLSYDCSTTEQKSFYNLLG